MHFIFHPDIMCVCVCVCVCIDKERSGAGRRNTEMRETLKCVFLLHGYLADQSHFLVSFKI